MHLQEGLFLCTRLEAVARQRKDSRKKFYSLAGVAYCSSQTKQYFCMDLQQENGNGKTECCTHEGDRGYGQVWYAALK